MRIGRFYDADPRRRDSDEVRFGDEWTSAMRKGAWNVFWIRDTPDGFGWVSRRTGVT